MFETAIDRVPLDRRASLTHGVPPRRSSRREAFAEAGIEPTLNDLLGDPLTHLLMERDGVSDSSLRQLIRMTKERLRERYAA